MLLRICGQTCDRTLKLGFYLPGQQFTRRPFCFHLSPRQQSAERSHVHKLSHLDLTTMYNPSSCPTQGYRQRARKGRTQRPPSRRRRYPARCRGNGKRSNFQVRCRKSQHAAAPADDQSIDERRSAARIVRRCRRCRRCCVRLASRSPRTRHWQRRQSKPSSCRSWWWWR